MRVFLSCATAIAAYAFAQPVQAQIHSNVFVQATFGGGTSTGGTYAERDEYSGEFMIGVRPSRGRPVLMGASVGQHFVNGSDLVCIPPIVPGGRCGPQMPRFGYAALLVGFEKQIPMIASVMAGPAMVRGAGSTRVGGQVRVELGTPPLMRTSLVVSPRLLLVPGVEGQTINLRTVSVGLRFR